jgi:hypothetical protein
VPTPEVPPASEPELSPCALVISIQRLPGGSFLVIAGLLTNALLPSWTTLPTSAPGLVPALAYAW